MDPCLSELPHGTRVSLVARVSEQIAPGCFACLGVSPQQQFMIINSATLEQGLFTFYDLVVSQQAPLQLSFCADTAFYLRRELDSFQKVAIFDICSGMGGFSLGSHPLGFQTMAFLDCNPLACDVLQCNFDAPVIHGSVDDIQTIKTMHALKPADFLQVTGGFPCQPYSRQGDMQGLVDPRGQVLPAILHGAWLWQAEAVLLECVDNALHFDDLQQLIHQYAAVAEMHVSKLVLDLQDQWPVRRKRFCFLLLRAQYPPLPLCTWPKSTERQTLGAVLPLDAIWCDLHEQDLAWDAMEMEFYFDLAYGSDLRTLHEQCTAPTMLHSWANVLRACPCGCRGQSMSLRRLQQGGARGFGVLSALTSKMRHLHPEEAALLCTVPLTFKFPEPPRAALCLLGQIAAPLQVLWLQSQLLAHLQEHFWLHTNINPQEQIRDYMLALLEQRLHRWTLARMYLPRVLRMELDGAIGEVAVHHPITAGELEQAETKLIGRGYYVIVMYQAQRLHPLCRLQAGVCYHLLVIAKRQARLSHTTPMDSHNIQGAGPSPCMLRSVGLGDSHVWLGMKLLLDFCNLHTPVDLPFVLYPFRAKQLLNHHLPAAVIDNWRLRYQQSNGHIMIIYEHAHHWTFLAGCSQNGFQWQYFDGLPFDGTTMQHEMANAVAYRLARCLDLGHGPCQPAFSITQQQLHTCGTIALRNMAQLLDVQDQLPAWDENVLHSYFLQLMQIPSAPGHMRAHGPSMELQTKLQDILQQHGVPADAVPDRARLVIQKLGVASIQAAFDAKNTWAYLKAVANRPSVSLRLVLPDELSKHVAHNASTRFGATVTNAKGKKKKSESKGAAPPLCLDPEQLVFTNSCFKADGDIVEQIPFSEVEAEASGIAICSLAQGCHFLQSDESISTSPLALLLTERPAPDYMEKYNISAISFAAKYTGTGEPVLVFGAMKNLGDIHINQHLCGASEQPALVTTQVIKVQIFRDEFQGSWLQLIQAPVRHLCQAVPLLQLCPGKDCGPDCKKSHAAVDEELDSILLEVWSRSFTKIEGWKSPCAGCSNLWSFP